jgi:hypothetical protein
MAASPDTGHRLRRTFDLGHREERALLIAIDEIVALLDKSE